MKTNVALVISACLMSILAGEGPAQAALDDDAPAAAMARRRATEKKTERERIARKQTTQEHFAKEQAEKLRDFQAGRFVLHDDQVEDTQTHLRWLRCNVGQQWLASGECVGEVRRFTFDDAQGQGGNGWRVPTKDELSQIYAAFNGGGEDIKEMIFPNSAGWYWSSSPPDDANAWFVDFHAGGVSRHDGHLTRGFTLAVRLVRGGP